MTQKPHATGRKRFRLNFWTGVMIVLLILAALFILYPFAQLFYQSFFPKGGAFSLKNYQTFFEKKYYMTGLKNSLTLCVCATFLGVLLGLPMAYATSRFNIWGKRIINIMVVLSMLSPPFIGAYSWVLLLGRSGFITEALRSIGIEIGSIYGFKGILLVFTLKLFPYVFMYVSSALSTFDSALEEASESLGVHGLQRVFRVTLPVIMPTILSSALMVFMDSLADFGTPLLIGEGYKTLPVMIYEKYLSEVSSNASFASTLSVVIVVCAMLVLALQKWFISRKNYTMSSCVPRQRRSCPPASAFSPPPQSGSSPCWPSCRRSPSWSPPSSRPTDRSSSRASAWTATGPSLTGFPATSRIPTSLPSWQSSS